MSKKTLYASFPSKRLLLEAVLVDKFRQVERTSTALPRVVRRMCWRRCINCWPACNSTPTKSSRRSCGICSVSRRRDSEWWKAGDGLSFSAISESCLRRDARQGLFARIFRLNLILRFC